MDEYMECEHWRKHTNLRQFKCMVCGRYGASKDRDIAFSDVGCDATTCKGARCKSMHHSFCEECFLGEYEITSQPKRTMFDPFTKTLRAMKLLPIAHTTKRANNKV